MLSSKENPITVKCEAMAKQIEKCDLSLDDMNNDRFRFTHMRGKKKNQRNSMVKEAWQKFAYIMKCTRIKTILDLWRFQNNLFIFEFHYKN